MKNNEVINVGVMILFSLLDQWRRLLSFERQPPPHEEVCHPSLLGVVPLIDRNNHKASMPHCVA
jgi:hypothetical protein